MKSQDQVLMLIAALKHLIYHRIFQTHQQLDQQKRRLFQFYFESCQFSVPQTKQNIITWTRKRSSIAVLNIISWRQHSSMVLYPPLCFVPLIDGVTLREAVKKLNAFLKGAPHGPSPNSKISTCKASTCSVQNTILQHRHDWTAIRLQGCLLIAWPRLIRNCFANDVE